MAVFERKSRDQGLSFEQLLINYIVNRVEGQGEGDQWKGRN